VLAVHLVRIDDDRLWDSRRDRVRGSTVHTSSRSPSLRQRRLHEVPSRRAGSWSSAPSAAPAAHPAEHRRLDAVDHRVVDLVVRDVPPPGQDVGVVETAWGGRARAPASVAVRTRTRSPSSAAEPAAIVACMPSG
jgi:hypothetical protein